MSSCKFDFDWVDFGNDADHRWLQVTFAQMTISVGNVKITRLLDKRSQSIREFLSIPLYPIAEWIVANWWALFEEVEVPSRGVSADDFRRRHSIRTAREGYAMPDLEFFPEGEWTRIGWKASGGLFQAVEFLEEGTERVRTEELKQQITDFIDAVVGRLEAQGVLDTWLQQEWAALAGIDPQERDFCVTAGWLGADPFELSEFDAAQIVTISNELPEFIRGEVFRATPFAKIASAAEWIGAGLKAIQANTTLDGDWNALRQRIPESTLSGLPWETGYQKARELRTILKLDDLLRVEINDLVGAPFPVIEAAKPPVSSFEGIVGVGRSSICCFTAKRHPNAKRFVCVRGLLGFLFDKKTTPEFYSSAIDKSQQRSRAFAAEFLAPASLIAPRLSGDDISVEEIEELASDFDVSPFVIEHQIRNHKLAKMIV